MVFSLSLAYRWQPELYEFRESDHPRDPVGRWVASGSEFGTVHHGGPSHVAEIDPKKLQTRDTGFWGKGFYVSPSKAHAGSYGETISSFRVHPNAKILLSSLVPDQAPAALVSAITKHAQSVGLPVDKISTPRTASEAEWTEAVEQWHAAVNSFAETHGYDIIKVGEDEMVVKNPAVLQSIHHKLSLRLPYKWESK